MSDNPAFGFGKFVPGFDFLQTLSRSATQQGSAAGAALPDWSQWVAPTLQVEEIDKRIGELRTVQFWLEQNARALAATIQALEVQKMTLDTLKGMNLQMSDLAGAFGFKGPAAPAPAPAAAARGAEPGPYDDMFTRGRAGAAPAHAEPVSPPSAGFPAQAEPPASPSAGPEPAPSTPPAPPEAAAAPASGGGAGMVDPLQWWNALTGQFQQIAATAMQEAAQQARAVPGAQLAEAARQAFATSGERATGKVVAGKRTAAKAPAAAGVRAAKATGATAARKAAAGGKPARAASKAPAAPGGRKR